MREVRSIELNNKETEILIKAQLIMSRLCLGLFTSDFRGYDVIINEAERIRDDIDNFVKKYGTKTTVDMKEVIFDGEENA